MGAFSSAYLPFWLAHAGGAIKINKYTEKYEKLKKMRKNGKS